MKDSTVPYERWEKFNGPCEEYDLQGFAGYSLNPIGFYMDKIFVSETRSIYHSDMSNFLRDKERMILVSVKKTESQSSFGVPGNKMVFVKYSILEDENESGNMRFV